MNAAEQTLPASTERRSRRPDYLPYKRTFRRVSPIDETDDLIPFLRNTAKSVWAVVRDGDVDGLILEIEGRLVAVLGSDYGEFMVEFEAVD